MYKFSIPLLVIIFILPRCLDTSRINPLMRNIPSKFNRNFPIYEKQERLGQNIKVSRNPLSSVSHLREIFLLHKTWIGSPILFWGIFW